MRMILISTLVLLPACNECSYWEQCDGDTLLVCGEGPDQVVGRKVAAYPCTSPNALCKQEDEHAWCVADAGTSCDPATYAASCDGDLLLSCPDDARWVIATDCLELYGSTCAVGASGAACEPSP